MRNHYYKDQIWVPSSKDGRTFQKAQNNEFVESELENWAKTSWTTNRMRSNDKNMKIDWFKLKKIVLDTIWGGLFFYISYKSVYKVGSWLQQYFSLNFSVSYSHCFLLLLYSFLISSLPSTCRPDGWCLIFVPSVPSWNF